MMRERRTFKMQTKICNTCGELKSVEDFYKRSDTGKLRSDCKHCLNLKSSKRWVEDEVFRQRGKQRSRKHQLMRDYGMSVKVWEDFSSDGCAICGTKDNLCVDHCHLTGEIRGCLCKTCNTGIGLLGDNEEGVKNAYDYFIRLRD